MDRRRFLKRAAMGAAGLASVKALAACSSGTTAATADPGAASVDLGPVLLRNGFADGLAQGASTIADTGKQRAVFSLTQDSALLSAEVLPASFNARLTNADGETRDVVLDVHTDQIPRHYLALNFEPFGQGLYVLGFEFESEALETQFVVAPIAEVPLVHPGDSMPTLASPTEADPMGIDPLCTRDENCGLHRLSIDTALATRRPFAVMISTPRFCTTGICGPTLEILLNEQTNFPDIDLIHIEVYTDPDLLGTQPIPELINPTLTELGMTFEPSLIVVSADGIVTERLDYTMDGVDIAAALATATASA